MSFSVFGGLPLHFEFYPSAETSLRSFDCDGRPEAPFQRLLVEFR